MTDPVSVTQEDREAAAVVFYRRARVAGNPATVLMERHHAKVILAGEGDGYDAVQAAAEARRRLTRPTPDTRPAAAGSVRSYPDLLSADEQKDLLSQAEVMWRDLQANNLGGFSGGNRPFWIVHEFKRVIEHFGRRDVGLRWSKNNLDAAAALAAAPTPDAAASSQLADIGIFATDNTEYLRLTGTGKDDARLFDVRVSRGAAETLMHEIAGLLHKSLADAMQAEFLTPTVKQDHRDERGELWEERKDVARLARQETAPDAAASEGDGLPCETCQGNGEVVTDWDRYTHAKPGDVGDEAVADCPDCDGTGRVAAASEAGEGWQDIAKLTDEDGYVIGWAERSDGCTDREHFLGRKYDIRENAIINEWTGRWRVVSHWQRLSRPALTTQGGAEG